MLNSNLSRTGNALSKAFNNLLLVIFVLGFLAAFNLQAQAQVTPPLECIALDDFENTELPGNRLELDAPDGNP